MDRNFLQQLEQVPNRYGDDALLVLQRRAEEGAKRRFRRLNKAVKYRLAKEFEWIRATNTAKLFLFWADVVASIKRITYPYDCSAQNCSLVSYCLGITEVDPLSAGGYFERRLSGDRRLLPVLFIEVPKGRREEVWGLLEEDWKTFIEIEENAARPDLPAEAAAAFFARRQSYGDKEILRRAAASLGSDASAQPPETLMDLTERIVYRRCPELKDRESWFLYQEDVIGALVAAGLSCGEAEGMRRAFAKKNRVEINFYRDILLQRARAAGRSAEETKAVLSAFERDTMFTVCRAAYVAMAQYLYMETCLKG